MGCRAVEFSRRVRERMGVALRVKIVPTLSPNEGDKSGPPIGKGDAWPQPKGQATRLKGLG